MHGFCSEPLSSIHSPHLIHFCFRPFCDASLASFFPFASLISRAMFTQLLNFLQFLKHVEIFPTSTPRTPPPTVYSVSWSALTPFHTHHLHFLLSNWFYPSHFGLDITSCRKTLLVVVQSLSRVRLFATHELQLAGHPCPSPSLRTCSNSCPLSQ